MMFSDINPIKDTTEHKDKAEELSAEQLRKNRSREYYQANKERIKEYYQANKGRYKDYYEANKERIKERSKLYKKANKSKNVAKIIEESKDQRLKRLARNRRARFGKKDGTLRKLIVRSKKRAKNKGMAFDITREWLDDRMKEQDNTCAATAYPFGYTFKVKRHRPFAPSIHRMDPNKGYTQDNCAVVCWAWNRMVGDSTDGITQTLIKSFIEKTKKEARESKKACPKTPSLFSSLDNQAQTSSDGLSSQGTK